MPNSRMADAWKTSLQRRSCGIIRIAALWALCRYRHNIHFTSPKGRCDRELGKRFGDHAYAREELVAELGAAFLCADLGITLEPRADHAAYIASWLTCLKGDKRAIFNAASLAQKAVDWLFRHARRGVKECRLTRANIADARRLRAVRISPRKSSGHAGADFGTTSQKLPSSNTRS
jgi:hypothetical protein